MGYAPILNAKVTAIVESDTDRFVVTLKDNGMGADTIENDGVYSGYFVQYNTNGRYRVKAKVSSIFGVTKVITSGLSGAYDPTYVLGSE